LIIYLELIRFLLPLVLTAFAQEVGVQVLNGGMARMPQATETLASFGLAWGLVSFLSAILTQTRQLGLVLVDGTQAYRQVQRFVAVCGLFLAAIVAIIALTPIGIWVVEDLHGLSGSLAGVTRQILLWLIPVPVLRGLMRFYSGALLRARRSNIVSAALIIGLGVNILTVLGLLPASFVQVSPFWLPVLATYAGLVGELVVLLWGINRIVYPRMKLPGQELSLYQIINFFWPLALIMAIQGFSRPLINVFVSRGESGAEALAVLTVVYGLGHLPYGWLNETRNLPAAFQDVTGSMAAIRRFILVCAVVSFGLMVLMFWTPVRDFILIGILGLNTTLAGKSVVPLLIFSFFPIPVALRGYLHGVGLLAHRTRAMAPSAPARILAIIIALAVLSFFGIQGASLGVAALLFGFIVETAVVWVGVRFGNPLRRIGSKMNCSRALDNWAP
jgi:hypothetical protein